LNLSSILIEGLTYRNQYINNVLSVKKLSIYLDSQGGAAPILLLLAVLGILVYLLATNTFLFKDRLLGALFPKPASYAQEAESVPDEVLIKFKPRVNRHAKDNIRKAFGLEKISEIAEIGIERGKVPEKAKNIIIEALKHNPNIEFIEPNYVVNANLTSNDPFLSSQWALTKINAQGAWSVSVGTNEVLIAVLDTGIDNNHSDLKANIIGSPAQDDNGHGTLVSGIASAVTNNAGGIASLCWKCKILSFKVLNASGSGDDYGVASAIIAASDAGAKVINMSLGAYSYSQTLLNAVNYASSKGIVLVAASGNDGNTNVSYPAGFPQVISVGSSDSGDKRSSTSNYGPTIDVVAPGVNVGTTKLGNSYGGASGTSLASPQVAALAGLILSIKPNLNPLQVRDIITSSVDDLGAVGKDDQYGYGRINSAKALQATTGTNPQPTPAPTPTPVPTPETAPSDTTNPVVNISNPSNGSTVSGTVNITASASDTSGIASISIFVDGIIQATCASDNCSFSWSTSVLTGSHQISAKALDNYSNLGESNVITANVDNSTPAPTSAAVPTLTPAPTQTPALVPAASDTTPPTVSINSPANNDTLPAKGSMKIQVSAGDSSGISLIQILFDNSIVSSCSNSTSCQGNIAVNKISRGTHTIEARATDSSSNQNTASSSIVVIGK
jgi:thermitase